MKDELIYFLTLCPGYYVILSQKQKVLVHYLDIWIKVRSLFQIKNVNKLMIA